MSAEHTHNMMQEASQAALTFAGDICKAITQAMQKAFVLVIVAGAVVTVSGLFMKVERLFGEIIVA